MASGYPITGRRAARCCCPSTSWVSALFSGHNFLVSQFPEQAQEEYWADTSDVLCTTASAMVNSGGSIYAGACPIANFTLTGTSGPINRLPGRATMTLTITSSCIVDTAVLL